MYDIRHDNSFGVHWSAILGLCFLSIAFIFSQCVMIFVPADSGNLFRTSAGMVFSVVWVLTTMVLFYLRYLYITNLNLHITDTRISKRHGIFFIDTIEIVTDRLESVETVRGLLDWIFGTATLVFTGTGGNSIKMPYIGEYKQALRLAKGLQEERIRRQPNEWSCPRRAIT